MSQRHFSRVLITGTTSGLGRAFHAHYCSLGTEVIEVNRRALKQGEELAVAHSEVLDITNPGEVMTFLMRLQKEGLLPDLFILNAGINLPDCLDFFDYQNFVRVMGINLTGVATFISAIHRMGIKGKTIATISSTSNIIPNPANIGYHISKMSVKALMTLLAKRDPNNTYKTVVLSPVHTNIQTTSAPAMGPTKWIFNALAIQPERAAKACARFFEGSGTTYYFTRMGCAFYYFVRLALFFFPFLYSGTQKKSITPSQTLAKT